MIVSLRIEVELSKRCVLRLYDYKRVFFKYSIIKVKEIGAKGGVGGDTKQKKNRYTNPQSIIIILSPTFVEYYNDSILCHRIEQQGCKGKTRKGQGF